MKHCNLTEDQMDEVLAVLNNERQRHYCGAIRLNRMRRATIDFLKREGWIKKGEDGKYWPAGPHQAESSPIFSLHYQTMLPVDLLWHVVKPMLDSSGYAGYSISANRRWNRLNLWARGQHHYSNRDEDAITEILLTLAQYGYIYAQFSGTVWSIQKRKDQEAA